MDDTISVGAILKDGDIIPVKKKEEGRKPKRV
jgi:hypothetical protein